MSEEDSKSSKISKQALETSMLYNISEMAQSVAYEINNPLMIINGFSKKILKNSNDPKYKDLTKDIAAIEKSGERINLIIQNLLAYSKQSLDLPLEVISFSDLVQNSISLFKETSTAVNVEFNFDSANSGLISVHPILCIQAIVNIFRRGTAQIGEKDNLIFDLNFRTYKERLELVIKDNSKKLSEDVQAKMFYQTFSTSSEGNNISMSMNSSFNIAKKFKGDLYFDNSYKENAFILSFKES